METVIQVLDKAREKCGARTDMALADFLGVTRAAVSGWRTGARFPDAIACGKLAQVTGLPLARVIGIVGEARALSREEKAVWRRLSTAAAIAVLAVASVLPGQVRASAPGAYPQHNALYIMRNRWWGWLRALFATEPAPCPAL